ncbi:MAG: hypothetical protein AUI15_29395 [Actinobacteria bacterium 13_2_20CM_2_66_6]|nr:MAG: hypothetical protein AUI15_29395 [Actinobacteria bacterium 13_2_20CM_2_66_6]
MATLVAFACGSSSGPAGSKGTIKIGSDLPVCTVGGQAVQNGIQFAINQKNAAGGVNGYSIQFQGFDDCRQGSYNADAGVENVQKMLGDSKFLGMIGPYNSAVAKAEIPIASPQHFVMISPSNTNPCLTKDLSTCSYHPQDLRAGNANNYWRVVTTDDYQGPAMADYMYKQQSITNVAILDDSTVFGVGIASAFEAEFKKLGGTVAKHSSYKKDQQGRFGGGDGIETTDCIDQATGNEQGILATSAGADATQVQGAAQTIADFRKAFPGPNDFGGYTMQAYDATNALMAAIGRAINNANGSTPTRDQVRSEMAKTKGFVGVIGTYDFDEKGDTSLKIVSIYVVNGKLSADQVKNSTGVCGSKTAKDACFVWKTQFDFAKASS